MQPRRNGKLGNDVGQEARTEVPSDGVPAQILQWLGILAILQQLLGQSVVQCNGGGKPTAGVAQVKLTTRTEEQVKTGVVLVRVQAGRLDGQTSHERRLAVVVLDVHSRVVVQQLLGGGERTMVSGGQLTRTAISGRLSSIAMKY